MPVMNAAIIEKQIETQNAKAVLSDRDRAWNVSIEAAHFYPIFGIGNGNWGLITLDTLKKSRIERQLPFDEKIYGIEHHHSHSLYLTALVERGVVGFSTLMLLMCSWFVLLIKTYTKLKKFTQGACLWGASFSAWIVTCGVGFVNSTFHHEHSILAFLFLGLHLSFTRLIEAKRISFAS